MCCIMTIKLLDSYSCTWIFLTWICPSLFLMQWTRVNTIQYVIYRLNSCSCWCVFMCFGNRGNSTNIWEEAVKNSGGKTYENPKWWFRQKGLHQQELQSTFTTALYKNIIYNTICDSEEEPEGKSWCTYTFLLFLFCLVLSVDELMMDRSINFEHWGLSLCHPSIRLYHPSCSAFTLLY